MDNNENVITSQETTASTPPPGQGKKNKKVGGKLILLIIAILLVVGGVVLFILGSRNSEIELNASPTPAIEGPRNTPTSTPSPSPTAEPADRAEVSIQVLNGTGIPGEAGSLQGELEDLGYEDIDVGNADDQDNESTSVTFSADLPSSNAEEITSRLEAIYKDVNTSTSSSQTDFDVIIITGLKKGATPAPDSTSTPAASASPSASPSN